MFSKLPQPRVTAYQFRVREAFNPNNLATSYYRTCDPKVLEKAD